MNKKVICLSLIVLAGLAGSVRAGTYSGGSGEPNDPYLIATAADMNEIGAEPNDWDAHFLMTADVNLADYTGSQFNIIGNSGSNAFTGVFDGNDYMISNFTYTAVGGSYIGLFGCINDANAVIKDLVLIDPNVVATTSEKVGALAGHLGHGTISGCAVIGGSASGKHYTGVLAGYDYYGTISNCYATGAVTGCEFAGGGLVGLNSYGAISNCYAAGAVSGDSVTGGLVGFNSSGTVIASFWDIETTGQTTSAGGTGKTTAEMKTESTFTNAGWDFIEIWNIGENQTYPFFRIYPAGDLNHDHVVDMLDFAIFASHWLEDAGQ
jgi:hypothetical protein